MRVIIIKSGCTHASIKNKYGDFDDLIKKQLPNRTITTESITIQHQPPLPNPESVGAVIITGSHDDVTDNAAWMIYLMHWIRQVFNQNIPLLGICFGHQIIAEALGGKVGVNPKGGEFGLIEVHKNNDLPETPSFFQAPSIYTYASHHQTVFKLPPGAKSLAYSNKDNNHLVCYGSNCWGVQFHPEFNRSIAHEYWRRNGRIGTCGTPEQSEWAKNAGKYLFSNFIALALQKANG